MPQFLNRMIQRALWTPFETWLTAHPTVNWLIAHPVLLALMGLVVFLFLAGLLGALSRLAEGLWLRFLQFPFRVTWSLVRVALTGIQHIVTLPSQSSTGEIADGAQAQSTQTDLQSLLSRLETVQQEEAEIMQQIKVLIHQKSDST